jgi:methyl-accepting chemotaxis protein
VRKLAEHSQAAAREISELSSRSIKVAGNAGEMLARIVPNIQKTAELVQEINAASEEQNSGAAQITQAIQQLEQVIQQNAGASEEMASSSEELASQADLLMDTIVPSSNSGSKRLARHDSTRKTPSTWQIRQGRFLVGFFCAIASPLQFVRRD